MKSFAAVSKYLRYNQRTGSLRWIKAPANNKKQYVGKLAGTSDHNGYTVIKLFGKRYYAHRIAWLLMTYNWPANHLDHKNGNTGDNRWTNLRIGGYQNNARNRKKKSNTKYGLKGVYYMNDRYRSRPFGAKIVIDGKPIYLGYFASANDAHLAYVSAAKKSFKEFARSA